MLAGAPAPRRSRAGGKGEETAPATGPEPCPAEPLLPEPQGAAFGVQLPCPGRRGGCEGEAPRCSAVHSDVRSGGVRISPGSGEAPLNGVYLLFNKAKPALVT